MFQILLWIIKILYLFCLIGMALYGMHNLVMITLFLLAKWQKKLKRSSSPTLSEKWPLITIQMPIYNERYTVERSLRALSRLDYPRRKLQIQVLDDSTDETAHIVSLLVKDMQKKGLHVECIHRKDRKGFKAGALHEGLKTARGEFIAIFDADFLPPHNWLKKTVSYFVDPHLGCLQTRWGHLNGDYNAFTRAISLGIDGHFIVEQTARSSHELFLNFNGTAGIWRKACIISAGGWRVDTLTEDLDLSYRAQLKGWKIDYLSDIVVPAELPVQIESFKQQQFRWAKGSFQTVRKLFMILFVAKQRLMKKILGVMHITGYFVHPLVLASLLLMLPIGLFAPNFLRMFPWFMWAGIGPPLMYLVSRSEETPHLLDRLVRLPLMVLVGFGLSLNNSIAVFEGLFNKDIGTFNRTPKFNMHDRGNHWQRSDYLVPLNPMVWGELGLAGYALLTIVLLVPHLGWGVVPWLLVYVAGFLYISFANIVQNWQINEAHRHHSGQRSPEILNP